jgi:hypothetical protein
MRLILFFFGAGVRLKTFWAPVHGGVWLWMKYDYEKLALDFVYTSSMNGFKNDTRLLTSLPFFKSKTWRD